MLQMYLAYTPVFCHRWWFKVMNYFYLVLVDLQIKRMFISDVLSSYSLTKFILMICCLSIAQSSVSMMYCLPMIRLSLY